MPWPRHFALHVPQVLQVGDHCFEALPSHFERLRLVLLVKPPDDPFLLPDLEMPSFDDAFKLRQIGFHCQSTRIVWAGS